ncbi:amidohydrolase family protein [Streptomyces misionensis]|uniref:Amidohydrolase family protein n=1 Tax=Streptomyces misionensis TaxID=67331 RepID=A0A5C6JXM2_9ACTN|nr:amidohydrolase family protein [Streptomyces misionensis]TWV55445.1 amidohydrolase family protein [Streptomyces misionensis]
MDTGQGFFSRRRFLEASAAGAAAASPLRVRTAAARRVLTYREMTGGSVTARPGGAFLIAEVQGVVWRIPRTGGDAVRLTRWELEATRPALSPDGRTVAVCGYRGGGFHLWTLRPDGGGLRPLTSGPWDDRDVAWSPDGTRLAFSSERGGDPVAGGAFGLWTQDLGSGRTTRLTGGAHEDYDPAWFPDGRSLVCVRAAHTEDGGNDGGLSLVRVPAAGGPAQVLRTVTEGRLLCPAVSPAGRIAYLRLTGTSGSPSLPAATATLMVDDRVIAAGEDPAAAPPCWLDEDRLLYVADGRIRIRGVDARGAADVEEIPFTARMPVPRPPRRAARRIPDPAVPAPVRGLHRPTLAPDGRSVAFVALNALWLVPVSGTGRTGDPRRLVQAADVHHLQMPAWAPDGRSLLYCTDRDGLSAVRRLRLADSHDEQVTGGGRLYPALSPDGSLLACQDVTGNVLVRDLATGEERVTARPLAADGPPGAPTWSSDGRHLAFCDRNRLNHRFREGYNLIRIVDVRTGTERRRLPADHQSLSDRVAAGPLWSPDGRWMVFVAESVLWLLPVAADGTPTGPARRLTDEPADHPSWAGDSRTLLYLSCGKLRLLSLDAAHSPGPLRTLPVRLTGRRAPHAREPLRVHAGQLWDATGSPPRQDMDVLIRGDRITGVEPHRARRPGHRALDASGQTVLPGLFDSHTHPYTATYGARQNLTFLAYGVTTTACMGGPLYETVRLRESAATGYGLGPRSLACAELIDGARTAYGMGRAHRTEAGVRATLRRAAALDVDFVKTYVRAPGRTMALAAQAAHRLGVPCGSHLCFPGRAAGQDLTTHLQATQRLPYGHATTPLGRVHQDLVEHYADGAFALIGTPFTAQCLLGADRTLADDPRVSTLMPPWDAAAVRDRAATPPTRQQRDALASEMSDYRQLAAHGAVLALGTDSPLVPVGLSLHLALRALHGHGFTAAEALHTVTTVPARLFGVDRDLGTVEAGKLADLTVVDGDPFHDFGTLVHTSVVLRDGVPHRWQDLPGLSPAGTPGPPHATWLDVARYFERSSCCHLGGGS